MYKVSDEAKRAIMEYKRDIRIKLFIDNKVIDDGDIVSFNITESILQDDDFKLGGAVASLLELKLNNIHGLYNTTVFENKKVNLEIGIKLNDNTIEYVPMGEFFIENSPSCGRVIEIEAVDKMVRFEKPYESKLKYPTTAKQVLKEACDLCNIELEGNFNVNYIVENKIDFITCRDVVRDIAILAAGFAKINKNGKLEIISLQDTDIEINKNNYISLDVKDSYRIEKLTITETNFPVDAIGMNLTITPFNTEWQGYFFLDVGDKVRINDGNKVYETILTTNEITYNGGIRYKSSCSGLNKTQQETQHISNQTKTNQKFASEIKQNADEIRMCVRNDELETIVTQNADSWGLSINGKLKGKTYIFNGDGFYLGDTDNQDVATHTNSYSEWKFSNGGKARVDKEGFYYINGDSRNEYHHLNYAIRSSAKTDSLGVFEITINIPTEFKGKRVIVLPNIEDAVAGNDPIMIARQGVWVKKIDYANNTITLKGQVLGRRFVHVIREDDTLHWYFARNINEDTFFIMDVYVSATIIA